MSIASKPFSALALTVALASSAACTGSVDTPGGSTGPNATGGGSNGTGGTGNMTSGGANVGVGGDGMPVARLDCSAASVPKQPLRRLTRFEYNNTVRDLAGVTDNPANNFPPEDVGNGFGTDANTQTVQSVGVEKYNKTAKNIAASLTASDKIAGLAPCATAPAAADEASCARTVIENFVPRAFRRPLEAGEADGLVQLFQAVRMGGSSFSSSVAAIVEAVLQSPEFLYRPEFGVPVEGRTDLLRPTAYEMANRLSYLYLGSMPDDGLRAAAASGALLTPDGVKKEAERLLGGDRSHLVVRSFFDSLLPIQDLASFVRNEFPEFTAELGAAMRMETQTFLEKETFGAGTWPNVFTANYTYVNETLAKFYGISGITGPDFQKVMLDGTKRAGLMTQAGIVSGPVHSDFTNPVVRGNFVLSKLMCVKIATPPAALGPIVPPDPKVGGTARERFTEHSKNPQCAGCHAMLDPIGFSMENFNAIGQWQDHENGKPIDVTVTSPQLQTFSGAVELGKKLAAYPETQSCFAVNWANYAYGRGTTEQDGCTMQELQDNFKASSYNIKELLTQLAQTDTFLYLPAVRE